PDRHVELPEDRRAARSLVQRALPGRHDRRGLLAGAARARDRDRGDRGYALASGAISVARSSSPTRRVVWPLPVVSSTRTTEPGGNSPISPPETSTENVPRSPMMKSGKGALCGTGLASSRTSRK